MHINALHNVELNVIGNNFSKNMFYALNNEVTGEICMLNTVNNKSESEWVRRLKHQEKHFMAWLSLGSSGKLWNIQISQISF